MAPSLEIRINSVADAKALVSDILAVHQRIKEVGADSVELKVAEECVKEANRIIYGMFRVKVYTSVIKCADGRILFAPAHFCEQCATSAAKSA